MDNKYQTLLAQLQTASTDEEKSWIMMQFSLINLSPTLQTAVWAAAIPHWFDFNYLNAILETPLQESDYFELLNLTFVEPFDLAKTEKNLQNNFNLHESTRKLLLKKLWEQDQSQYRQLSRRAALYCSEQNQEDTAWRVETLYHALLADLPDAEDNFINQGIKWHDTFQLDKLEILNRAILETVHAQHLIGEAAASIYELQGLLDTYFCRHESAKQHFNLALQQKNISQTLQANCIINLGNVDLRLGNYEQAKRCYEISLRLFQEIQSKLGQANCIQRLGNVDLQLGHYKQARKRYETALPLFQNIQFKLGQANCVLRLGDIDLNTGNYEQARQRYETALYLFQEIQSKFGQGVCYWQLGLVDIANVQFEKALVNIQQAIDIFNSIYLNRHQLVCSIMFFTVRSQISIMIDQLQQLLEDKLNLTLFNHTFFQILKLCEKYPDKPAFVELRKRIETALNENKETPP